MGRLVPHGPSLLPTPHRSLFLLLLILGGPGPGSWAHGLKDPTQPTTAADAVAAAIPPSVSLALQSRSPSVASGGMQDARITLDGAIPGVYYLSLGSEGVRALQFPQDVVVSPSGGAHSILASSSRPSFDSAWSDGLLYSLGSSLEPMPDVYNVTEIRSRRAIVMDSRGYGSYPGCKKIAAYRTAIYIDCSEYQRGVLVLTSDQLSLASNLPGRLCAVDTAGGVLYTINGEEQVVPHDISQQPLWPAEQEPLRGLPGFASTCAAANNTLVVGGYAPPFVSVLRRSPQGAHRLGYSGDLLGMSVRGLAVAGGYVLAHDATSAALLIDISNIDTPFIADKLDLSTDGLHMGHAVGFNDGSFLVARPDSICEYRVVERRVVLSPVDGATYTDVTAPFRSVVSDRLHMGILYAPLGSSGLRILSIRSNKRFSEFFRHQTPAGGVAWAPVNGGRLYVVGGSEPTLSCYDVSGVSVGRVFLAAKPISTKAVSSCQASVYHDGAVYSLCKVTAYFSLAVFNVSNDVLSLANVVRRVGGSVLCVDSPGARLFVASETIPESVVVYNISDPYNPISSGRLHLSDAVLACGVSDDGRYIYFGGTYGMFAMFSLHAPFPIPTLVASMNSMTGGPVGAVREITPVGVSRVVVHNGVDRMTVLSVSEVDFPAVLQTIAPVALGPPNSTELWGADSFGSYYAVAEGSGVAVYSVAGANPTPAPTLSTLEPTATPTAAPASASDPPLIVHATEGPVGLIPGWANATALPATDADTAAPPTPQPAQAATPTPPPPPPPQSPTPLQPPTPTPTVATTPIAVETAEPAEAGVPPATPLLNHTTPPHTQSTVWCETSDTCHVHGDAGAVCASGRCLCSRLFVHSGDASVCVMPPPGDVRASLRATVTWASSCSASEEDIAAASASAADSLAEALDGEARAQITSCTPLGLTVEVAMAGVSVATLVGSAVEYQMPSGLEERLGLPVTTAIVVTGSCSARGADFSLHDADGKCRVYRCSEGYTLANGSCNAVAAPPQEDSSDVPIGSIAVGVLGGFVALIGCILAWLKLRQWRWRGWRCLSGLPKSPPPVHTQLSLPSTALECEMPLVDNEVTSSGSFYIPQAACTSWLNATGQEVSDPEILPPSPGHGRKQVRFRDTLEEIPRTVCSPSDGGSPVTGWDATVPTIIRVVSDGEEQALD